MYRNMLKLDDFTNEEIMDFLYMAKEFKLGNRKVNYNGEKIIANLFFEPSTRTHYSFDMAALKLGCKTIDFSAETSSLKKGETLYDTVKVFEVIGANALIIRHNEPEYYKQLEKINIPIINGGDGSKDHPSQALLDLFTIQEEFGEFKGLTAVIVGDIAHSRVAHSNIRIMERLGMNVYTSGPKEYSEQNLHFVELDEIIPKADILMFLRIQNERHEENNLKISTEEYNKKYGLNIERVNMMKEKSIIMHPAPFNRNIEITDEVIDCPKSRICNQMENGVYVRMAILNNFLK